MKYLSEIKAFYDRLEIEPLTTSQIALWHALMHMANKSGWKDSFTVAIVVLEIKTGLKKQAILNARIALKNKGLIDFKSRNSNLSAVYTINSLIDYNSASFKKAQTNTQTDTQTNTQTNTQTDTINRLRLDKTRQDKTNSQTLRVCNELQSTSLLSEPAVISLTLNDKSEYLIYSADIKEWSELYQSVDVISELRKMKGWLDSNPQRRKTKKGIKRFINSWLCREQDKGKTLRGYNYGDEQSCSKNTRTENEIFINTDEYYKKQGLV